MIKGKIYKIVGNDLVYYGSTKIKYLSNRIAQHRYIHRNGIYCTSQNVITDKKCKIYLVEEIECENIKDLRKREYEYIRNNECVNKNGKCFITPSTE